MSKSAIQPERSGEGRSRISRRLLLGTGWCGFLLSIVGPALANLRFLFPNVVYEGPTLFKLGRPEDYPPGSVTFLEEQRLYLLREPEGFRALSAVCTHLGCTVQLRPDGQSIWCACHNGLYDLEGRNVSGPPPRPLESYVVHVVGGDVVVEKAKGA